MFNFLISQSGLGVKSHLQSIMECGVMLINHMSSFEKILNLIEIVDGPKEIKLYR